MAQDLDTSQPLAAVPAPLPEPQTEPQSQASYAGGSQLEQPMSVASPDPGNFPTRIPVEPAHLLALLAGALGLAALAARLIVNYSVLFSA